MIGPLLGPFVCLLIIIRLLVSGKFALLGFDEVSSILGKMFLSFFIPVKITHKGSHIPMVILPPLYFFIYVIDIRVILIAKNLHHLDRTRLQIGFPCLFLTSGFVQLHSTYTRSTSNMWIPWRTWFRLSQIQLFHNRNAQFHSHT